MPTRNDRCTCPTASAVCDGPQPDCPVHGYADAAMRWLQMHPDQAPGRTITVSEISKAFGTEYVAWARLCLARIGITVVPDPEPTNVERLRALYMEWEREGPRTLAFAEWMDIRGVTAPGGDDPDTEHNRAWWIENANVNDAEDCEACVGDLCPVHHGIALGIEFVTKKIAALGGDPELFNSIPNPPKAPGGES